MAIESPCPMASQCLSHELVISLLRCWLFNNSYMYYVHTNTVTNWRTVCAFGPQMQSQGNKFFSFGEFSACTVSDHLKIHLTWVSCLNFIVDAVQLPPEPVLWCCIQHLSSDSGHVRRPERKCRIGRHKLCVWGRCNDSWFQVKIIENLISRITNILVQLSIATKFGKIH